MRPFSYQKFFSTLAILGCLATPVFSQTAAQKGESIAQRADQLSNGFRDFVVDGNMELRTAGGSTSSRRFTTRTLEEPSSRGTKSLLVFDWPGDIRGTALLTHSRANQDDSQWLYLPSVGRVKRIVGSSRSGSFVGSEFAYEDMVEQDPTNYTHIWQRDEACPNGAGQCHLLIRKPRHASSYLQQAVWIDKQALRYQVIQYYNRRGQLMKTLSMNGYRKYKGKFWRPSRMQMVNHLTGKSTRLDWKNYRFGIGLSASEFTQDAMRRVR